MHRNEINPESTVLQQIAGQYDKLLAVVIWKLAKDGVTITMKDLAEFLDLTQRGEAVLFTHGHKDSIEFSIVTAARAAELAEFDRQKSGGTQ